MPKEIQDNNNLYNILSPLVQFGTRCHYNHFCVRGIENLPTDGAYIIAPCHQQALMEPLAVLRIAPKPPVFLARADLFAKPTLRAILTFLRILPVYRIRDGQKNVGKNHAIFEQSCRVLLDGYPLCLMAEGRHNNRHHLLNMGKGMFRIAGEAQQRLGTHPVYIVPTGIDFDEYEQPYSNVVVNIGKPIPLQPFMKLYRDNEPVALNQMRDALAKALMPLMHDIRNEEHYDEIMTLCNVLNRNMRRQEDLDNTAWNRFKMRQQISRHMDFLAKDDSNPMFEKLTTAAKQLQEACRRLHLTEKTVSEHWRPVATLLALLPLIALIVAALTVPALRWTLLFCLLCYPMALIPTHLIVKRSCRPPVQKLLQLWHTVLLLDTLHDSHRHRDGLLQRRMDGASGRYRSLVGIGSRGHRLYRSKTCRPAHLLPSQHSQQLPLLADQAIQAQRHARNRQNYRNPYHDLWQSMETMNRER